MPSFSALGVVLLALAHQASCAFHLDRGRPHPAAQNNVAEKRARLQNVVTWDNYSLSIHGERLMIYSGEYHPFRLPVPSLWIDVFHKIKALGLNTASFYVHWAQLEGKPGHFRAEGIFDYTTFFDAAKNASVYLTARPGPYINAEVSGGGYPGWLQRIRGHLRTLDVDYLAATDNYAANINKIIAQSQITHGGPIILYQPENEYTGWAKGFSEQPAYMQYVEDQARKAGIVVPFMSNDAGPLGHNAPGSGVGEVDIYGQDGYPLGFDCTNSTVWPAGYFPTKYRQLHVKQSPTTPFSIPEFQGGSFDPWGGPGFDMCLELLNQEQIRVFYKNNYAAGVTIQSLYMIFGGTNWGNLGHPGGYTSYDYAAVIAEDRTVTREKYSELKLQAHFLKVSPGYLVATPAAHYTRGIYSANTAIAITPVTGPKGSFYIVRHSNYSSLDTVSYTITLPTSLGNFTAPQLGGSLTLTRRDSKIHVTDYPVGDATLVYSTAEIFTWQQYTNRTVVIVYGGPGELHEMLVKVATADAPKVTGSGITLERLNGTLSTTAVLAQWRNRPGRRIIEIGQVQIYVVDRNSAYKYWVPELEGHAALIVNGGYLVRSAAVSGRTLSVRADFNTTGTMELIGVPSGLTSLTINHDAAQYTVNADGNWVVDPGYTRPKITVPALTELDWYSIDSLPEIQPDYDDSAWTHADHTTTNNTFVQPFLTPVSLYGSDYGYHAGALLFRGHFTSSGAEAQLYLSTQGGTAFGASVWLNRSFVGSWPGNATADSVQSTFALPALRAGGAYVLTVLLDNMGLDEDFDVGSDMMKNARGILDYYFVDGHGTALPRHVNWKLTGNLGGEDYADRVRGPLNEGGLYVERQGYHQGAPPLAAFAASGSPFAGVAAPGVAYYTAKLALDLPSDTYDVPLRFVFGHNMTTAAAAAGVGDDDDANSNSSSNCFRAWLYVNGFQFGRYLSHIGPQTQFPVPEGILNYQGDNWIGLALWAPEAGGARVPVLELVAKTPVLTGRDPVQLVDAPVWKKRPGAY